MKPLSIIDIDAYRIHRRKSFNQAVALNKLYAQMLFNLSEAGILRSAPEHCFDDVVNILFFFPQIRSIKVFDKPQPRYSEPNRVFNVTV